MIEHVTGTDGGTYLASAAAVTVAVSVAENVVKSVTYLVDVYCAA